MGHTEQANARLLLGTVPVEEDGSAYFQAPARKPLYFQAVDETGRAVQGMRSIVYLQSGERRGCVGCHEPPGAAPAPRTVRAAKRPPSVLQPGPEGSQPFGYVRLVQPLLDQYCVRCHDGTQGQDKSPLSLTGQPTARFSTWKTIPPVVSRNLLGIHARYYKVRRKSTKKNDSRPLF